MPTILASHNSTVCFALFYIYCSSGVSSDLDIIILDPGFADSGEKRGTLAWEVQTDLIISPRTATTSSYSSSSPLTPPTVVLGRTGLAVTCRTLVRFFALWIFLCASVTFSWTNTLCAYNSVVSSPCFLLACWVWNAKRHVIPSRVRTTSSKVGCKDESYKAVVFWLEVFNTDASWLQREEKKRITKLEFAGQKASPLTATTLEWQLP